PMPERNPAGDSTVHQSVGQFGDVDHSITKFLIMELAGKATEGKPDLFNLSFGQRPEEELYDVKNDPYQLNNLATDPTLSSIKAKMKSDLLQWMTETGDLRATNPRSTFWDEVRYTPTYLMKDADVSQRILEYRIMPPFGPASQKGIPCLSESN
ncbi:MAG: heparan N-sulfatase, partial [Algoriphagus sp.]|nr:heparan N-sulfatase [Algoriphagus sp.]